MPAHAIIVLCPSRPDLLGQPLLGHVAWGFQLPNNEWIIGAVEGDGWKQGNGFNGFWSRKLPNLNAALQYFANMSFQDAEYNHYKLLTVTDGVFPNPNGALNVMKWVSGKKYELFGRNCMNSAYDILRAFSSGGSFNGQYLPTPEQNWIPNGWFNAINVPSNAHQWLPKPTHPVHAFQEQADEPTDAIVNMDDIEALEPAWRNEKADDFLPIDAAASEKAEKVAISVVEPEEAPQSE